MGKKLFGWEGGCAGHNTGKLRGGRCGDTYVLKWKMWRGEQMHGTTKVIGFAE